MLARGFICRTQLRLDWAFGAGTLVEAVGIVTGQLPAEPVASRIDELFAKLNSYDVDFGDVRAQEFAKRAVVVSAAGGHNVLMM